MYIVHKKWELYHIIYMWHFSLQRTSTEIIFPQENRRDNPLPRRLLGLMSPKEPWVEITNPIMSFPSWNSLLNQLYSIKINFILRIELTNYKTLFCTIFGNWNNKKGGSYSKMVQKICDSKKFLIHIIWNRKKSYPSNKFDLQWKVWL